MLLSHLVWINWDHAGSWGTISDDFCASILNMTKAGLAIAATNELSNPPCMPPAVTEILLYELGRGPVVAGSVEVWMLLPA